MNIIAQLSSKAWDMTEFIHWMLTHDDDAENYSVTVQRRTLQDFLSDFMKEVVEEGGPAIREEIVRRAVERIEALGRVTVVDTPNQTNLGQQ